MKCTIDCCKDCKERYDYCHSHCEEYKAQKAAWDKKRAEEKKRKREEYVRAKAIAAAKTRMSRGRK